MEHAVESRLDQLVARHGELSRMLAEGGVSGAEFARLSKEFSELSPIVETIEALRRAQAELRSAAEMVASADDPELKALAEEEVQTLRERVPELELEVKTALLPKDDDDSRTPSSRSAPAPAARKRRCSPPSCSGCTSVMRRCAAGASR